MDKGLLFFTLAAACFWLIFDDLTGKKRLSNIALMLTPDLPGIGEIASNVSKDVSEKIVDSSAGFKGLPGARERQANNH